MHSVSLVAALSFGSCFSALSAQQEAPAKPPRNVSGGVLRPEQACFDVLHYRLEIAVDPATKTIDGTLTMRAAWLAAAAELQLDLSAELSVRAMRLGGAPVPFEHRAGVLHIRPAAPLTIGAAFELAVDYGGTPHEARRPPWDGGITWAKTPDGAPWIATTCQGEGADLWWPCKDHPSDKPAGFDLVVTVPNGLVVAGNGTRQGEPKVVGERTTFHWQVRSPISNYNIALAIAPYVELTDTFACIDGTTMPIQCFVLPSSAAAAKKVLPRFLDHVKAFEELLGPYPFRHEKYGFVETPHLGMEHQTMIAYGNGFADEPYDWLHNHELAHEWWGNLVTCRDWKDMWLHEGFGTYLQPLYLERRFGRARYDEAIRGYKLMNRQPIAPREVKNSHEIYFSSSGNDIYYKGSAVLHTLRWLLGEERFFAALRLFCYPNEAAAKATDGSQVRFVDTDDFVRLCNKLAGTDVAWFFEVYVRQAALPRLQTEVKDGVLLLRWITPQDLPFPMPVPVVLDGAEHRVKIVDGIGRLEVGTRAWQVDPERRLLMGKQKGSD